jgi:UDP-glucose 4-epimerase
MAARILVTGGSGFVGSHVVDGLLAAGYEPRIFDIVPSAHHPARSVDTYLGDVSDGAALRDAMVDCDAVIHLAAIADVSQVAIDPIFAEQVNAGGTLRVLEAAREAGVSRVLYASTIWVYGDTNGDRVDEASPLVGLPRHPYTATKIAGEMYTASYGELYDLEWTILRFGIPYGPRARPTAVVPAFTAKALAGQPLTIAGDGTQSRRFVYVEDLAEGVVASLVPEAANRVYNLVGRENTSVRAIARAVRDVVGDVPIEHIEGRAGDLRGGNISGERAASELGWEPRTSFADGVRRYVEWVTEEAGTPRAATASSTDGSAAAVLRQESSEL